MGQRLHPGRLPSLHCDSPVRAGPHCGVAPAARRTLAWRVGTGRQGEDIAVRPCLDRAEHAVAHDDPGLRVHGDGRDGHWLAQRFGPGGQPVPYRLHRLRRIGERRGRPDDTPALAVEVWMQDQRTRRILEHAAIAGIQVAFRRQPLGQQHVMRVQFDMEIGDGRTGGFLDDGRAVDEQFDRDQLSVQQHRVGGGQAQGERR